MGVCIVVFFTELCSEFFLNSYKDTEFMLLEDGDVKVTGSRYPLSGKILPKFRAYWEKYAGLDVSKLSPAQSFDQIISKVKPAVVNTKFMEALETEHKKNPMYKIMTAEAESRLLHSHAHSNQEIFTLRYGHFYRYVDLVIYPGDHSQVERFVKFVCDNWYNDVCIIPYGGGNSVSQALLCPENENRMIISVDMSEMSKVKWIDFATMTACVEAGANGLDLEKQLEDHGVTTGHEPDSWEFSTVGGWVATRASGMMKNEYGNIEDLLVSCKMVSPIGVIEVGCNVPRKSTGPDVSEIIMGSEGTMGIITEAVLKIKKIPGLREYSAIVFPDFEKGVQFMQEIAQKNLQPGSIRLIDNSQFHFGQSLKPKAESMIEPFMGWVKNFVLTTVKGFDIDKLAAVTMLIIGNDKSEIQTQLKRIVAVAQKYGGLDVGSEAGRSGYLLTYVIAYLRDFAVNHYLLAESFESAVPWPNVASWGERVKKRIIDAVKRKGVQGIPWVTARVSQVYHNGGCCYFYFAFVGEGLKNPIKIYSEIEDEARDEILSCGGSLSHHHGVGKLRRKWMNGTAVSPSAFNMLKKIKQELDPHNVFANGNMGLSDAKVTYYDEPIPLLK